MKQATKRSILRWIHLVFSIPIIGYVYSPFENIPAVRRADSVCLPSHARPDGIVDVERPCSSTALLRKDRDEHDVQSADAGT